MAETAVEPAFRNVSSSGLKIISKGGVPVDTPSEPSTPLADDTPPSDPTPAASAPPAAPTETPAPAATTPPTDTPVDTPADTPAEPPVDFFVTAKERTRGLIKSPDDVFAVVEENQRLQDELSAKEREPIKFPSDGAKKLYDYCLKFPGGELPAARSALHVLSLDVDKLSPKEAQFEAFALKNQSLSRDEARKYFEARYEKNFGEGLLDEDVTAQYDHRIQTEESLNALRKMQQDLAAPQPSQPAGEPQIDAAEIEKINQNVQRAMSQFSGVKYQFFDDDPDSVVNIPMEDSDTERFNGYLRDPNSFFKDFLEGCCDPDTGDFDHNAFVMRMFEIAHIDRISEHAFNAGAKYGELKKIKELKNTSTLREPTQQTPAPAAPKTFQESWLAAHKAQNAGR